MEQNRVIENIRQICKITYRKEFHEASNKQKLVCVAEGLKALWIEDWIETSKRQEAGKMAYYFSAEYLMGRALGNNLINMGIYKEVQEMLGSLGVDLEALEEEEEDAGLGNGGLGRLAACFMESGATMGLPLRGYGIRYSHGLFRQKLVDGAQQEEADCWLREGDLWSMRQEEFSVEVHFQSGCIKAVPYDVPIVGYGNHQVNTLRLWQAEPVSDFDFHLFNSGDVEGAVRERTLAENLSKVLYPNDQHETGRILRLKQQYFLVSASLQDLMRQHIRIHGEHFDDFAKWHQIQLNDTHPVLAIPEFVRLLVDQYDQSFEQAVGIARGVFAYTNHTILQEALEKWEVYAFDQLFPRILEIIRGIEVQVIGDLYIKGYSADQVEPLRIIKDERVHMANLAIHIGHTINGVAQLHTEILKTQELAQWYQVYPHKFQNKTNGITPRRWLCLANPGLSDYITTLLGGEAWKKDLSQLKRLEQYQEDEGVLRTLMAIKTENKKSLARYIEQTEGVKIQTDAVFDVQVKRLHEYKRQLLNAFYIVHLYYRLKENPHLQIPKVVFIFGAKAFPGYRMAKGIIHYIGEVAKRINNDPEIGDKLKVVFVSNYGVSTAQKLMPAADVSKQISTAGKEASGTGNMKLMLSGAVTFGTYDGANVEIVRESGEANNYIFGLRVEDLMLLAPGYYPRSYYEADPDLMRVVDSLVDGTFDDGGTGEFREIYESLLDGRDWQRADPYYVLADFAAFKNKYEQLLVDYQDELGWAKKSLMNIANTGIFSSDRTILDYSKEIWDIE
ncbi:MAG: glycogen/starch/alpha-glucan phosphorylase [Cellulosilyticaceae bacterium]